MEFPNMKVFEYVYFLSEQPKDSSFFYYLLGMWVLRV